MKDNRRLRKQLIYLCTGEFLAVVSFVFALISITNSLHIERSILILYPFCLLIFVLLQGSYYWFYRLRRISGKVKNIKRFIYIYRIFRLIDIIMIMFYPLTIYASLQSTPLVTAQLVAGIFIYIFAIGEFINYFYIRLSYSKIDDIAALIRLKNLRRSSLNKEISRTNKTTE